MPEFTIIHIGIGLVALTAVIGVIVGWLLRGNRCAQEKIVVNAGWQEQLEAQRVEHERLLGQNKNLMEQISEFQTLGADANNRAKELSTALKENFVQREELQREIKEIRGRLETAIGERDGLQTNMVNLSVSGKSLTSALQQKDDKIFRLSRELENWQGRLPPLLERFRVRDEEAQQLETDLGEARDRVSALESMLGSDQTRVDPIDTDAMSDDMIASNDPDDRDDEPVDEPIDPPVDEPVDPTVDEPVDPPVDEPVDPPVDEPTGEPSDLIASEDILDEADNVADELVDNADDDIHKEEHHFQNDARGDELHNDFDTATPRDDLKQIKGVGPAIEKTLNELGIFRLSQIAEMSEYDIDRVAKRLKGFRSRIYREDWIGQARDLQDRQASEQA
jgi:predicted flap endonuclease-1-like 5' DNA nuclease